MRSRRARQMRDMADIIRNPACPKTFAELLEYVYNIPSDIQPIRLAAMLRSIINGGTVPWEDVL